MKLPAHTHSFLLGAMLVIALAGCGKSPEQHVQDGTASFEQGDFKTAILELKSALQEQPGNREARLLLGKAHLANAAYEDAEKELIRAQEQGASYDEVLPALAKALLMQNKSEKVLELVPGSSLSPQSVASLQVSRATALLLLGKRPEAEQAIQAASIADAQSPELLLLSAKLALIDQDRPKALRLVDSVLENDKDQIDAIYMKAGLLSQEGKDTEAIQQYQQIVAKDAKQISAHLAIFRIQANAGKLEEAEKSLMVAEKIAGNVPLVIFSRGILELSRGKLKEANEAMQQVLKASPDYLPAVLAQANISYGLGNFEQSLKNAQKILVKQPNHPLAIRILAGSQLKMGDGKTAMVTLAPLLNTGAEDAQLLNLAAEIHFKNEDFNKAMHYLDRAVALDPKNPDLKTRQALSHLHQGNDKEALAYLVDAVHLNVKPGRADFALVILHLQNKQFDLALQAIDALEKKLPNNPITHNLRAAAQLGKQDKAGARKELETALNIEPTFVPAAIGLARLDLQDKNFPEARKRFESILAKDQNNLKAMLALADLAKVEKKESEYLKWLERAAKTHPESIPASEHLVRFYLAKKNGAKAVEIARQAVSANPENAQALALLGSVQAASGANEESVRSFNTLVEKNKNSPGAYLQLALAQLNNNQTGQARTNLTRALQLKPDYTAAQEVLIRLEMSEKKPEAALKIARAMQQQNAKSPIGYDLEGNIQRLQNNHVQAVKSYEQALAKDPRVDRFIKLHQAMKLSGDVIGAEKRLNIWLDQHSKDITTQLYAAQVYLQAGRNREAVVQYENALKSKPNDVLILNNLAALYQKEKDPRALGAAEKALKLKPDNPSIMDTLGWILLEQGQLSRATDLLRKAAEKAPKSGTIRYHLAVALRRVGIKQNARKELEAAISLGQEFQGT
jgi:putative PEP-CTERM system TPR-repeat lipoprotein